jgi:prenyltransferase beta subunit
MSRKIFISLAAFAVLVALAVPVQADEQIDNSLAWLMTQQQPDGGFTNGFSEGSDLGTTCDIALAIAAAGQDASTWTSEKGNSPLDYLQEQVASGAVEMVNQKAKVVMAWLAAEQEPTDVGGVDLLSDLSGAFDEATGSYGENVFEQALAVLALHTAGQPVPQEAIQYLLDRQADDGAWALFGDTAAGAGDTNTTAMVIQALVAVGEEQGIAGALDYLQDVQNEDGGFPYQSPSDFGTDTDTNSTALVLQALMAAGESLDDWAPAGTDPRGALDGLYEAESGAFLWQAAVPGANVLATAQVIPALAGVTFVDPPRVEAQAAPEAATAAEEEVATPLPAAGGRAVLPLALVLLGAVALALGLARTRRASCSSC